MENQQVTVQKVNQNHKEQNNKQTQQSKLISRQQNKTFKAKCGIFFGYNGQKYFGMQYQRDTQNTIENVLHKMWVDHGFILKTNAGQLKRIAWSRSARTDKKVHALCNGISVKLQISQKFANNMANSQDRQIDFDKLRNYFNAELPMDIRIFAIQKVARGFDMRHDALTRVYNYIIPTYIFQKPEDFQSGKIPSLQQQKEIIQRLNILCKCYLGTKSFHNFTKGYKPNDPRCERYMISMKAQSVQKQVFERYWSLHKQDQPTKRKVDTQRYIRFTLVGQSFIYHQIRKMIGLLIKIFVRGLQGQKTIQQALKPGKYVPYLAPGQGLYLNRMTFQSYNKRKQKNNQKTVQLSQQDQQRVLKFRQYLQSQILHHQVQQKVFTEWLKNRIQYQTDQKDQQQEQQNQQEQQADQREQKGQKQEKINQEKEQNQDKKQGKQDNYHQANNPNHKKNKKKNIGEIEDDLLTE